MFLEFRSMLLLQELKTNRRSIASSATTFTATKGGSSSGTAAPTAPSAAPGPQPSRAPVNPAHGSSGYDRGFALLWSHNLWCRLLHATPFNPWTEAIQMWHVPQPNGGNASSILGARPCPSPRPHAYMTTTPPAPVSYYHGSPGGFHHDVGYPSAGYHGAGYYGTLAAPRAPSPTWDPASLA